MELLLQYFYCFIAGAILDALATIDTIATIKNHMWKAIKAGWLSTVIGGLAGFVIYATEKSFWLAFIGIIIYATGGSCGVAVTMRFKLIREKLNEYFFSKGSCATQQRQEI